MSTLFTDLHNKVKSISGEFGFKSLESRTAAIDKMISERKVIDIAVLGQFKSGKSSFLNSLTGIPILPVGVTPVTSVITRLYFGKVIKISITKLNHDVFEINEDEINDYVSESENPQNIKQVLTVDIELPELKEFEGLRFVDTPGIGSIFKHNTETTSKWIPHTGTALMLITADRPLAESELYMIKELQKHCPEIVIIITKTDLLNEDELSKVYDFVSDSLRNELNGNFGIYFYSVFKETDNFKKKIFGEVLKPILDKLEEVYKNILAHKINSFRDSCFDLLEISHAISLKDEEDKRKLKSIIDTEKSNLIQTKRELHLIAKNYTDATRENIYTELERFKSDITERIKTGFDKEFDFRNGSLYKISRRFEEFTEASISKELNRITEESKFNFSKTFFEAKTHIEKYTNSFRRRLNDKINEVLGVRIPAEEFDINENVSAPDVSNVRSFDMHIDLLWFLIPMIIFRKLFKKKFKEQIAAEVDKNIHRYTSDLTENVNIKINSIRDQSFKYIESEVSTVDNVLNQSQINSERLLRLMNSIQNNSDHTK